MKLGLIHALLLLSLLTGGCTGFPHAGDEQARQELIGKAKASLENRDFPAVREYLQQYTAIAPQTAETLWIGVQAEYVMGNQYAVSSYVQQLREQFPDSAEYRAYLDFLRGRGLGH